MKIIKSKEDIAEDIATRIDNSVKKLSSSADAYEDSKSTILGNKRAKEIINSENSIAKDIAELFLDAGDKISLVCEEFKKKDSELGNTLGRAGTSSKSFSINV